MQMPGGVPGGMVRVGIERDISYSQESRDRDQLSHGGPKLRRFTHAHTDIALVVLL